MTIRTFLLIFATVALCSACSIINTETFLSHQIIASPKDQKIGLEEEAPLDVSHAHEVTAIGCSEPRLT